MSSHTRNASLFESLIPILALILFLGINVLVFDGSPHIPLIFGTVVAVLVGMRLGYRWPDLEQGIVHGIVIALQACLILMVIGMLIGTWIVSGIVPTMIYYGLTLLSPSIFLVTTCIICALVSLATGSSWSTAGTVGVALMGVGQGLGVPLPMVAGAIISGAYLGDKMSPLSDTTNLAPAVVGTDMFGHIRHMAYTTLPAFAIALVLYTILGFFVATQSAQITSIDAILTTLHTQFQLGWYYLIPPALVIVMVVRRIPALPALLGGAVLGGIFAVVFQGVPVAQVLDVAQNGYVADTRLDSVNELLTRGGMESMLSTVALIITALSFGGAMEKTGMLQVIAGAILTLAKNTAGLIISTLFTCISMNIIAPDQYLSIVVPGRMYKDAYARRGLHPKNLSRALEDGGTLSSSLVPWNTGGAYMWATLGVYPLAYLPFAFVNLITPMVSAFYGATGWTIQPADEEDAEESELNDKGG